MSLPAVGDHKGQNSPDSDKGELVVNEGVIQMRTTLIPPGAQYGATLSKAGKGKPFRYAAFAILSKPLQRLTDHS